MIYVYVITLFLSGAFIGGFLFWLFDPRPYMGEELPASKPIEVVPRKPRGKKPKDATPETTGIVGNLGGNGIDHEHKLPWQ